MISYDVIGISPFITRATESRYLSVSRRPVRPPKASMPRPKTSLTWDAGKELDRVCDIFSYILLR